MPSSSDAYGVDRSRMRLESGQFDQAAEQLSIIDALRRESVFLNPTVIPAGAYPAQSAPIHTLGVHNLLDCRRDLDEHLVDDQRTSEFAGVNCCAGTPRQSPSPEHRQCPFGRRR